MRGKVVLRSKAQLGAETRFKNKVRRKAAQMGLSYEELLDQFDIDVDASGLVPSDTGSDVYGPSPLPGGSSSLDFYLDQYQLQTPQLLANTVSSTQASGGLSVFSKVILGLGILTILSIMLKSTGGKDADNKEEKDDKEDSYKEKAKRKIKRVKEALMEA